MKLTEHQLKEIQQKSSQRQRTSNCPSADELFQLLSNSLDSGIRRKIASHLEVCTDCSQEFKLARQLSENLADSAAPISFWQKPEWRSLLAAAAIVLALTAGILITKRTSINTAPPVERGEQSIDFKAEPADGEQLDAAPAKLKWSEIPGAQNYRVALLNYESSEIANSGLTSSTEYSLPEEIRNKLQSGQIYYWRIEYEKAGEQKSKLLHFNVR
ncbi:hypothetical protein L0152_18635 [bacterium]|nr:hypothetical protein [bacterium]